MKAVPSMKVIPFLAVYLLCTTICSSGDGQTLQAMVTVDSIRPVATVNPYIYGQFIEHMGRCIRGGIWAEMLHDRKFFLEPGKSWQPFGFEGADYQVMHDSAGAYCGDHCMALWVRDPCGGACGIRQDNLGLIEDKEYAGYAVVRHVAGPVTVTVRLSWGEDESAGQDVAFDNVGDSYTKIPFRFRAGATTDDATLSVSLSQPGYLWIGCLSLMPADNVDGMRADTLELLKKLNSPIYRWPGGNFVSGYNWKDGIGPRDRRPPRWDRAWEETEDNDFGIDEFIAFCRFVDTEPLIVVNTGLGSVEAAAEEVEYVNGSRDTRWGSRRAQGGHPEPYGVVWWGAGNEMYGQWQQGHVPAEQYAVRHNAFVRAMRRVDPKIKIVTVGAPGPWNDVIVPRCAAQTDLLSGHHYTQRELHVPFTAQDTQKYRANFFQYSGHVAQGVRRLVNDLRARQEGSNEPIDHIRLSVDEWGMVRKWEREPDAPGIGIFEVYYPLGDAVANGRALHELIRSAAHVQMAHWSMAVNVVGAIKTNRTHASLGAVGHVLALYRQHVTGQLLPAEWSHDVPLDVVATWGGESEAIAIGLINYSPSDEVSVKLRINDAEGPRSASGWRVHGPSLEAFNVPGKPETVITAELPGPLSLQNPVILPACSIAVLQIEK